MPLILRSLFGLTGNGDPLPTVSDYDIALAVDAAPPLREAVVRAPRVEPGVSPGINPGPENTPDYTMEQRPGPSLGR